MDDTNEAPATAEAPEIESVPETTTIVLRKPIGPKDGPVISELVLRAPKAADLIKARASDNPRRQDAILISALSGVDQKALDALGQADYREAAAFIQRATHVSAQVLDEESGPITLKKPIKIGPLEISVLTLHEPTLRDMVEAADDPNQFGEQAVLLSKSARVPLSAVQRMEAADFLKAIARVRFFTEPSPTIGASSSPT